MKTLVIKRPKVLEKVGIAVHEGKFWRVGFSGLHRVKCVNPDGRKGQRPPEMVMEFFGCTTAERITEEEAGIGSSNMTIGDLACKWLSR